MPGWTVAIVAALATSAVALSAADQSRELSARALDCLHRGDDTTTPETRTALYREGLAYARQALVADEANPDAHFAVFGNQGRLMLAAGVVPNPFNLVTITRELDRTLELDPNHTDALGAKGAMYRQLPRLLGGSLDKAAFYLSRAIELDPNAVGARIELAATYRDMGQPERAIPLLRTVREIAPRMQKFRQLAEAEILLRDVEASAVASR